jgi:hypothetical protein
MMMGLKKAQEEKLAKFSNKSLLDTGDKEMPYSIGVLTDLEAVLIRQKNAYVQEYARWIDGYECNTRQAGVLLPVKSFGV